MFNNFLQKIQENWKSGLTVSLVSIPLSVSLAVASQTSPVAGIITAIWAGVIASIFGGSNFNIVGPTGALSGILATYAIIHGAATLPMLAIITGVIILVAYATKLERYLVFVPASTIHGFTLGVAFIIGLNQLNFALGLTGLTKHEKFIDNLFESLAHLSEASFIALAVFLFFLISLLLLAKLTPKIPGAILLSPIGILFGYLASNNILPFQLETLGSKFSDVSAKIFLIPTFSFDISMLSVGLTVAFVAILETMISAKIADGMTKTKHHKRKEMLGLGLANIASGLFGGIPATAALARTSLNIKTGATDKISATISSIAIAVISLLLLTYFKFIPMAVIAAILVFVAIRMVEAEHFIRFYKYDKKSFYISLIVAFVTIYEDPIIGILLGTVLSLLLFMDKLSRGQFDLVMNHINKGVVGHMTGEQLSQITKNSHVLVYSIKGHLAYINSQAHITRFEEGLKHHDSVVLRIRELYFIDGDGAEAFDEIIEIIHSKGKKVLLSGVNPNIESHLNNESKEYKKLKDAGLVFEKTTEALTFLGLKSSKSNE